MKSDLDLKKEYSAVIDYLSENSILFDRVASLGRPVFIDDPKVTAFVSLPKDTNSELEDSRLVYAFGIQFWNSIDDYTRQFVAAHEFLHLFLMHWQRLSDIKLDSPKIKKYLPIAVDIPINDMLFDYFGFIREWVSIDYCSVRTCFKPEDIRTHEIREHQDIKYYLDLLIKLGSEIPSSVDQHTSDQVGSKNKSDSEEEADTGDSGSGDSGSESTDSGSKTNPEESDGGSSSNSGDGSDSDSNLKKSTSSGTSGSDSDSKNKPKEDNSENLNNSGNSKTTDTPSTEESTSPSKSNSKDADSSNKTNEAKPELPSGYHEKSKEFSSLYDDVKKLLEKMEDQDLTAISNLMQEHPEYEGSGSSKFGVGTVVTSVARNKAVNTKRVFKDTTSFWLSIVRDKTKIGLSRDEKHCYGFSRIERGFYDLARDGSVFPPSYSERIKLTPKPLVLFCFDYSGSCVRYFALFEKLIEEIPLDKFEVAISLFNTQFFLTGSKGPVYISSGGTRIGCIEEFLLMHEDGKSSVYFESAKTILNKLKEKYRELAASNKEFLNISNALRSVERFESIKKYPSAVFVVTDLDDHSFSNVKIKYPERWTFLLTDLHHLRHKPEKSDYYLVDMLLRP